MFDPKIVDIETYNNGMKKSLIDKAFFLDKVDADIFVDFGCADGLLIEFIEHMFPDTQCIGYDISPDQLDRAAERTSAPLFSDWNELLAHLSEVAGGKKVAVICNSLIHEVYAYGDLDSVEEFWSRIFNPVFKYVIIRDMCVSKSVNRVADIIDVAKVRREYDQTRLTDFETNWGMINNNWSLVHFLLKYRYVSNWDREVKENYLPINFENLLLKIPTEYNIQFVDHYTLPYLRQTVKDEFDINIQDNTHVKLILKRN